VRVYEYHWARLSASMDRPFIYAIRDDETGALLFVGVLEDPT
jgi:serine protease inhibitor